MNVPVALIGLIATLALVPESRAPVRPGLDPVGYCRLDRGLVGVTYGLIEAGETAGADISALIPISRGRGAAGRVLPVGMLAWAASGRQAAA